jgi:predicted HicB family RNase H-like nuclease
MSEAVGAKPKISIETRMPEALRRAVEEAADREGVGLSEWVRAALEERLGREGR